MKRKLWISLALAILAAVLCCGAALAEKSGKLNDEITWTLTDEGKLTISGSGEMPDYNLTYRPSPFEGNKDIKEVTFGNFYTNIGNYLFYGCTGLTRVELPFRLKKIGNFAFAHTGLGTVELPVNVTSVGYDAFADCASLEEVIVLSTSAAFDTEVFADHASTLRIRGWAGSTAETHAKACGIDFEGWEASGKCGSNVTWTLDEDAKRLTLTGTGTTWDYPEEYPGFYAVHDRIRGIKIEDGVTSIGDWLFYNLYQLDYCFNPDSLTKIGKSAFYNCPELSFFSFGRHVTTVGKEAFYNSDALKRIEVCNPFAEFGENVFQNGFAGMTISGFAGSTAQSYAKANSFSFNAWSILGKCGENLNWTYDLGSGRLLITGTGKMGDYDEMTSPWFHIDDCISMIEIGSGVTTIGDYAFWGLDNAASVKIPNTVVSIGRDAFNQCGLTGITIPDSVTSIGPTAFDMAYHLTKATIPDSVTFIGKGVFASTGLTDISIPESIDTIGVSFFASCDNLTDVTIPDSVTTIETHAFGYCSGLVRVTIPHSVNTIGQAFHDSENLKDVTILNPNASIEYYAFGGCAADLTIHGWPGSTAEAYASKYDIAFEEIPVPDADFFLPSGLVVIDREAFRGIRAKAAVIPKTVYNIVDDPFARSGVQAIYGYKGTAADTFASQYGYYFVGIDDAWMKSHRP